MTQTAMQIWQHKRSGDRYVVQVAGGGDVADAAGPLHYSEIEEALKGFDGAQELADDLANNPGDYWVEEIVP